MKLKKLATALFVVCALGAVMASSALAAATTEDVPWTIEGVTLSGSETVSSTGSGELKTVGTPSIVLKWTGAGCISCSISNSSGSAVGAGELKFTGVTVATPTTCAVSGGSVTTKPLSIKADYMGKFKEVGTTDEKEYDTWLFEPTTPSTFATVTLVKSGTAACPISGSYPVTGKVFIRLNNLTGVPAVTQGITANPTINAAGGGTLEFFGKPSELFATGSFSLSGANKGKNFDTK